MTKRRTLSRFVGRPGEHKVITTEEAAEMLRQRKAETEAWIKAKKKRRAEELKQKGEAEDTNSTISNCD